MASVLILGILAIPVTALAIATTDPAVVAAFQAGATIITFEGIAGVTPFNNQTPGTAVPAAAQLKSQIPGLTFFSNASGGPYVLNLTGFSNITDAKSPPNVLSGTDVGDDPPNVVCFTCFIEVTFASPVSRVGAWNDPTGSLVQLLVSDLGGGTIFGTQNGNQGEFIGIDTGTSNIQRALFLPIQTQSVAGFTIDDLTFPAGPPDTVVIPEPATLGLLATGFGGLALVARRRRRR